MNTTDEALHDVGFSDLLSPHPASFQIFFSVPCSHMPAVFIVKDQVSHPYKTTGKIVVLYIPIFTMLADEKTEGSVMTSSKHYPNSVSFKFPSESNFDLLLPFPNVLIVPYFEHLFANELDSIKFQKTIS
jgi:hypothetical protein